MFLEKLEILGFKSFARKTKFQFNSGITGVVGPNGCGKSNIVDAIRWVLGEQRAGTLRSERMENVIFNGSRSLKPLGMAEVAMTIKNTKNLLPVEYTEVVVTRRLFRSGESQYLLNNVTCRLRDILNLFLDSGMGFDAYSVIELKMVEDILSGRPEERRRIFEQAAGISKYKQRRVQAFRKLDSTEKDLLRVNDIISEVQKNVESLNRQVSKARRYQNLADRLNELEVKTATCQFSSILDNLDPLIENYERLKKDFENISAKLNLFEADIENFRTQRLQVDQKLSAAQDKLNQANRKIQQKENEVILARERINAINESNRKDEAEKVELTQRLEKLQVDRQTLVETLDELKASSADAEKHYRENLKILEASENELKEKRAHLDKIDKSHLQIIEDISNLAKEQERFKIQIEHNNQRLNFLTSDESRLTKELTNTEAELEKKESAFELTCSDLERKKDEKESADTQISDYLEQSEDLKNSIFKNKNQVDDLENRILLIRKLMESLEDYPEGVRHLLLKKGETDGFPGAVADFISIPGEYRLAIEVFLGEASTFLITHDHEHAYEGIRVLRQAEKGHVTFIPMESASVNPGKALRADSILSSDGVLAQASQVITAKPEAKNIVTRLFEHCFIVKDLQTARILAGQFTELDVTFVSVSGEFISTRGFIKGGARPNRQSGPIGRADELRRMEVKQADLLDQIETEETKRERLVAEIERLTKIRTQLNQYIRDLEQQKTKFQIALGQLQFTQKQNQEQLSRNSAEREKIETDINEFEQTLNTLGPNLSQAEKQRKVIEAEVLAQRTELALFEKSNSEQANKVHQLNVEFVELQGRLSNTERELSQSKQLSDEYKKTIQQKNENIETGKKQKIEFQNQMENGNQELESDFVLQDDLEKVVLGYETERSEIIRKIDDLGRRTRGLRFDREQSSTKIHDLELQISEKKLMAENIQQRLLEEYEIQIKRIPLEPDISIEDLKAELEAVRTRLKGLGAVNLLAIQEHEKEKERFDFLESQQNDLMEARNTLTETIDVINKTAREQFFEIYQVIRKNFREVFHGFFPDGEADLLMPDSGDVLENEIEVVANSKGKRLGSLALLSGGEKTLTAISLLFAIYLVKPSPFCILDEVDAPLDDVNINRFVQAIEKFSDKTQFILVTHNKLTMKAANSLYGITMTPDGVSKVVSVKMESD